MKKCIAFVLVLACLTLFAVSCTDNGGIPNDTQGESLPGTDSGNNEAEIQPDNNEETTAAPNTDVVPDLGDNETDTDPDNGEETTTAASDTENKPEDNESETEPEDQEPEAPSEQESETEKETFVKPGIGGGGFGELEPA